MSSNQGPRDREYGAEVEARPVPVRLPGDRRGTHQPARRPADREERKPHGSHPRENLLGITNFTFTFFA